MHCGGGVLPSLVVQIWTEVGGEEEGQGIPPF